MTVDSKYFSDAERVYINGGWRAITRVNFSVNNTTTSIVGADAANKIYVLGVIFNAQVDDATFKLTENTVGDISPIFWGKQGGGAVMLGDLKTVLYKTTTVNKGLDVTTTVGIVVGTVVYALAP